MTSAKLPKDEQNTQAVLNKIAEMPPHIRQVMQRMHEVIMVAAPDLKPRIWYGMPGYAKSSSSPVLVFFRNDELMTLGLTEKATLKVAGDRDGLLIPCAWYFSDLDDVTEKRIEEIVQSAIS